MKIDFNSDVIQDEWLPTFGKITDDLVHSGFSIIDNLLDEKQALNIKQRLLELKAEDEFEKSGIGKAILHKIDDEIRGDFIRWIETDDLHPSIEPYYTLIANLILYLNRNLYINLKDLESHYAYYPKGKGYLKHRDRFKNNPHRVISLVLYLNDNWQDHHGGELDIFNDDLTKITTIHPIMNRLVIFKSEMIHEVLPSIEPRYSITTWLLDKEKELTFL